MQVILLERVERLGQMGDTVNVKPGYARNFLLPSGKALRATKENQEHFKKEQARLEAQNLEFRSEAQSVAAKMESVSVVLVRQAGESGQLYGSVNARDVADELDKVGFNISRSQVRLNKPIKALGLHKVAVSIHPEVSVSISANVARSSEEAEIQAKTGKAVLSTAEEEARTEGPSAEASLADAAEALAGQANRIFEKGAAENAIIDVETAVEEISEESLGSETNRGRQVKGETLSENKALGPETIGPAKDGKAVSDETKA